MPPKIIVFAPERPNNKLKSLAAKVMVTGDCDALCAMVDRRKADLILLLDASAEIRDRVLKAARNAGNTPVICLNDWQDIVPTAEKLLDKPDPLEQARRYMDDNFHLHLTLNEIAGFGGLSAGYFCRSFKTRHQVTPITYLRNLRLARATHLLLHTELPLAAITDQSGFFSVSYFCREFHKAKGLSPIAFRRQHSSRRTTRPRS